MQVEVGFLTDHEQTSLNYTVTQYPNFYENISGSPQRKIHDKYIFAI